MVVSTQSLDLDLRIKFKSLGHPVRYWSRAELPYLTAGSTFKLSICSLKSNLLSDPLSFPPVRNHKHSAQRRHNPRWHHFLSATAEEGSPHTSFILPIHK